MPRSIARITCAGLLITGMGAASAQTYPVKPIRIIASDAGGGSDIATRIIAQSITAPLGQPVLVENRAGGVIAGETVAKAPPDGYTILFYGNALWLLSLMRSKVPYDTLRDFAPISLGIVSPSVLTVHPSLPVKSVKDLIAMAKARPGQLNYASPAIGTSTHMAMELFKSMAGVNIVRVAYKGGGAAFNDLLAGQVDLAFVVTTLAAPNIKSGRLRGLAISSAAPSPLLPGVPTVAATGLPGYESLALVAYFAPAKTPDAIINRLNQEIVRALARPEIKEKFIAMGVEGVGTTPEELTNLIKSEIVKWGKVIKEAGIRDE